MQGNNIILPASRSYSPRCCVALFHTLLAPGGWNSVHGHKLSPSQKTSRKGILKGLDFLHSEGTRSKAIMFRLNNIFGIESSTCGPQGAEYAFSTKTWAGRPKFYVACWLLVFMRLGSVLGALLSLSWVLMISTMSLSSRSWRRVYCTAIRQ